jgi:hypothetical protein
MNEKRLLVTNQGHTDIVITGVRYNTDVRHQLTTAQTVAPTSSWFMAADPVETALEADTPKGSAKSVPFYLYFQDEHARRYVLLSHLLAVWLDNKFQIFSQTESTKPDETK